VTESKDTDSTREMRQRLFVYGKWMARTSQNTSNFYQLKRRRKLLS